MEKNSKGGRWVDSDIGTVGKSQTVSAKKKRKENSRIEWHKKVKLGEKKLPSRCMKLKPPHHRGFKGGGF